MAAWSERKLIERIQQRATISHNRDVIVPIGDDCCLLATGECTLISTDTLVDSVHFDTNFHDPFLLGRKSIAVNLSDIAAMGGVPRYVLLSLCLPASLDGRWIDRWIDGACSMLDEFACVLVGGDTVKGESLVLSITILGSPLPEGALYRSGAKAGDSVWVSGVLGSAGAGLALLQASCSLNSTIDSARWPNIRNAHLNPVPQVILGQQLAKSGCVSSMQDISDGLATDLAHLCFASKVSARIRYASLPMEKELQEIAKLLSLSLPDLLLRAGEDYQLLFTVKEGMEKKLLQQLGRKKESITQIGHIVAGQGVFLEEEDGRLQDISFQGYEH